MLPLERELIKELEKMGADEAIADGRIDWDAFIERYLLNPTWVRAWGSAVVSLVGRIASLRGGRALEAYMLLRRQTRPSIWSSPFILIAIGALAAYMVTRRLRGEERG